MKATMDSPDNAPQDFRARVQDARQLLLQIPGVVSVSPGYKESGGELTTHFGLRVYVEQKRNIGDVPPEQRIPIEINGFTTDVVENYLIGKTSKGGHPRPLVGGLEISEYDGTQLNDCTKGCIAKRISVTGDHVVVSNQHIFNSSGTPRPDRKQSDACCPPAVTERMLRVLL